MSKLTFDQAFERLIGHEGNFTNDKDDRGNWTTGIIGKGQLKGTKYGISAMTYPQLDIKNLTLDQAKQIYKKLTFSFSERLIRVHFLKICILIEQFLYNLLQKILNLLL